jgi:hypothetical protein
MPRRRLRSTPRTRRAHLHGIAARVCHGRAGRAVIPHSPWHYLLRSFAWVLVATFWLLAIAGTIVSAVATVRDSTAVFAVALSALLTAGMAAAAASAARPAPLHVQPLDTR